MSAHLNYSRGNSNAGKLQRRTGFKLWMVLLFFIPPRVYCQQVSYDEVSITMNVQSIGSTDVSALITDGELFLSVNEVFDYLKITHSLSANADSISGAITGPKDLFLVDAGRSAITYRNTATVLRPDELINSGSGVYLKASFFGKIFGLDCSFNFRNLSATVSVKADLPLLREKQQELIRKNLNRLRGSKKADTTISRNFSFFRLGMADWTVTASQGKDAADYTRGGLALGGILAGGELDLYSNYSSNLGFDAAQQYFKWRYVNNNMAALKQITVGRLATSTLSTLQGPLSGVQLTNRATTYRRSFGTYTITNTTKPGWTVELYVDNVLVNYTRADASGFFTFDVPMMYGNSLVKLRFYGPSGEESSQEQMVSIPFNFLPAGQLEYNIAAGEVEDRQKSNFARGDFAYGLNRSTTIGGGVERLSSAGSTAAFPFVNASIRLGNNTILTAEQAQGVRAKGSLNYRSTGNVQLQLNYIKYTQGQKAVLVPYKEEKSLVLSFPSKWNWLNSFTRMTYQHFLLPEGRSTNAELLISGSAYKVNSNLTTKVTAFPNSLKIYTELSMTWGLPLNIRFTPLFQYEYTSGRISKVKAVLEKTVSNNGTVNVSYETSPLIRTHLFSLGVRLNFSTVSSSFSALLNRSGSTFVQSAGGSLLYDGRTRYRAFSKNFSVGRGALSVVAYLDLNNNGVRDSKEPVVRGLKFSVNGGRVVQEGGGSISRVLDLEPYRSYLVEVDPRSFDNLSWRIRHKTIAVETDPNNVKLVEVPVSVMSEASGYVAIKIPKGLKGLSRMIVNFYRADSSLVGRSLTEEDGFFSFMELRPGNYVATLDSAQLGLLGFEAFPRSIAFTIKTSEEGVIADGFQFTVISHKDQHDTAREDIPKGYGGLRQDSTPTIDSLADSSRQRGYKPGGSLQKIKPAHSTSASKSATLGRIRNKLPEKNSNKRTPSYLKSRSFAEKRTARPNTKHSTDRGSRILTGSGIRKDSQRAESRGRSSAEKPDSSSYRKRELSPNLKLGSNGRKTGEMQLLRRNKAKITAPNEAPKQDHPSRTKHSVSKTLNKAQPLKRKPEPGKKQGPREDQKKLLEQLKRLLERSVPHKAEMAFVDFYGVMS